MRLPAVLLLIATCCAAAEPRPDWVGDAGRAAAYPEAVWLVGWSEDEIKPDAVPDEVAKRLAESCRAELARSVRVRVESVQETKSVEVTGSSGNRFSSSFADSSKLSSDLNLQDSQIRTWIDEEAHRVHAIAAMRRADFANAMRTAAGQALDGLSASADEAQAVEDASRPAEAQAAWGRVLTGLRQAGDDAGLARGIGPDPADAALIARIAALHTRAAAAVARLAGRQVATAEDLAYVLAAQLGRAANDKPLVLVPAFTVRDSRMSSPFGRYLAQEVATKLAAAAGWKVSKASAAGPTRAAAGAAGAEAVVLGATWDRPDGVRVVVAVHHLDTGAMIAAAEATLPAAGLAATGLAATPQNAAQALADQQQFRTDEVIGGGMRLEVWTSKGDDAPVFLKSEKVQIFARVDRPAHLRLTYHLADGRRALLLDDLYIDEAKVNQVYQLPDEFEVDAPFGAEVLQANASTTPFPKLAVRSEDGYPIITDALPEALAKTRGLKKVVAEAKQAEARVVVTTVEK